MPELLTTLNPQDEMQFQSWYGRQAKKLNLSSDPDDPKHFYDYRAAWKAGDAPDKEGHWPSTYKLEGHPRMIVGGMNTKTGEPELLSSHQIEPIPFDIDSYISSWNSTQPVEKMADNWEGITNVLYGITKPFLAQGYVAGAAVNRALAGFSVRMDALAKYHEAKGGGKSEGLFRDLAEIYESNVQYWQDRANKVGVNFLDELIGEATGGAIPGIAEFMLNVPYSAIMGAAEAQQKGENEWIGALTEAGKRGVLGAIFKAIDPLKKYLKAPIMGTVFGVQAASEGGDVKEIAKGVGTGLIYGATTPGGQMGLNDVVKQFEPQIAKARELAATGGKVLASERGAIGVETPKPEGGKIPSFEEFQKSPLIRTVGEDFSDTFLHGTSVKNIRTLTDVTRPETSKKPEIKTGKLGDLLPRELNEFGSEMLLSEPRQAQQANMWSQGRGSGLAVIKVKKGTKVLDLSDEATRTPLITFGTKLPEILQFFRRPAITDDFIAWYKGKVVEGYKERFPDWENRIEKTFDPDSPEFEIRTWREHLVRYARERGYGLIRLADETLVTDRSVLQSVKKATQKEIESASKSRTFGNAGGTANLFTDKPTGAYQEAYDYLTKPSTRQEGAGVLSILKEERGSISLKPTPETKQRKFLKTVEEAAETDPTLKEKVKEIDPQEYTVQHNQEMLDKAEARIKSWGIDDVTTYLKSDKPLDAEKGATFIKAIERFQQEGDFDRAVEMVDAYDLQLREAGRFIQAASIWNRLTPGAFIRWAEKELAKVSSKYSWADTILGRKPDQFTLTPDEKKEIFQRFTEINKMPDGIDKTDKTLQMIDFVAQKVPPSVSEIIDAYRYQNMLSGPRTQMRNIGENIVNAFGTRPVDIVTKGGIDFVKASLQGKERQAYVADVAPYVKASINAVPNALHAFMEVMRGETGLEKPELGIESKTQFEQARTKQLPKALTIVQRFMEASDKFNAALIGAGEFAIQKQKGATDEAAYKAGAESSEKYLYRDKLQPGDPSLSYFSQALSALGKIVTDSRKLPALGPVMKWFVPFIRTPINKGIQMVEHSPLGAVRGKWDEEAAAKIMNGAIVTGIGALFALYGETTWTPPPDPKEKEWFYATGRKPFSVKIGDSWIPIWYTGPFALALGIPMAVKHYTVDSKLSMTKDATDKLLDISEGLAQFLASQTSAQSIGAFFRMINGDVDYTISGTAAGIAGQMIPAESMVRFINTIIDPVHRKPKGFWEQMEKDIPFLSQNLEARKTPLLEPSVREPINYFLPYDTGKSQPVYENLFPMVKGQVRQEYLQNKTEALIKKMQSGQMSAVDAMEEMSKILGAASKPFEEVTK